MMRTLSREGYPGTTAPANLGQPPELSWLSIADLVVDDEYQRPISEVGRRNVLRIAEQFNWLNFAPLIVAPVGGGKYAVIDGQHRATAAWIRGIDRVPASIVPADRTQQAAAFKAVNGNVTQLHAFAMHHAAIAGGDPEALAVARACEEANVRIPRSPTSAKDMKPGMTLAIVAIKTSLRLYGHKITVLALRCITATRHNVAGALRANAINGIAGALGEKAELAARAIEAMEHIELAPMIELHRDKTSFKNTFAAALARVDAGLQRGVIRGRMSAGYRPPVRESSIPAPSESQARREAQR